MVVFLYIFLFNHTAINVLLFEEIVTFLFFKNEFAVVYSFYLILYFLLLAATSKHCSGSVRQLSTDQINPHALQWSLGTDQVIDVIMNFQVGYYKSSFEKLMHTDKRGNSFAFGVG